MLIVEGQNISMDNHSDHGSPLSTALRWCPVNLTLGKLCFRLLLLDTWGANPLVGDSAFGGRADRGWRLSRFLPHKCQLLGAKHSDG